MLRRDEHTKCIIYDLAVPTQTNLTPIHQQTLGLRGQACVCTHFSISLFLQVLGVEDEEEELGSCLLLSPLLVEGISTNTVTWENEVN